MRIGEIAILGSENEIKKRFIKTVCDEIKIQNDSLIFGKLAVNRQLLLHLYGLNISGHNLQLAWDLVSRKLLGYIVLFDWNNLESYTAAKSTIDFVTSHYDLPLVVAANLNQPSKNVSGPLLNANISVEKQTYFTFCRIAEPRSAKNVLLILVDSVIERLNQH
ncbi:MAG: hypothetical protein ACE5HO_14285 [bacterium]